MEEDNITGLDRKPKLVLTEDQLSSRKVTQWNDTAIALWLIFVIVMRCGASFVNDTHRKRLGVISWSFNVAVLLEDVVVHDENLPLTFLLISLMALFCQRGV
jgi:hypothetical protein